VYVGSHRMVCISTEGKLCGNLTSVGSIQPDAACTDGVTRHTGELHFSQGTGDWLKWGVLASEVAGGACSLQCPMPGKGSSCTCAEKMMG
jgi:hypothetical protein